LNEFNKRSFIFILCGLLSLSVNCQAREQQPIICSGKYALCSAAACQQIPGLKDRALCQCSLWQGKNIGFSSCEQRKPQKNSNEQVKLLSTFSFGGMHFKYMKCPKGNYWTSCLDQPCLADKNNLRKAHCNCKIESGTPYVTFAGMCDANNCNKSMWSGAKIEDNIKLMILLSKSMESKKPIQRACPTQ
jgi:hypothetical protein